MFGKYQTAKEDLEEHAAAIGREKDDMMDSIRLLRRQMKLKDAIIEAFIPLEVADKVTARAVWDEDDEFRRIATHFTRAALESVLNVCRVALATTPTAASPT